MSYQLITTEKPTSALKIASALADSKFSKKALRGISYYELSHNGKSIVIASAAGHLFTLGEKKKSSQYPVFDIHWVPSHLASKKAKFTKKFYDVLISLAKKADSHVNACDVDIEGELIFKNILEQIYHEKNASRMYYSTLTKDELIESYKNMKPEIDHSLAEAGETRHMLDYFWGISTSRALTNSIKVATTRYKLMSSGRVQGPALKLIIDKEREIRSFIPVPYWEIELNSMSDKNSIVAYHKDSKFWEKEKADSIMNKTKNGRAFVTSIESKQFPQAPPHPFDLTSLQLESYRALRISPKETLEIAQALYLAGIISYPRTSSNQLPVSLGYKKILESLKKNKDYKLLVESLLKQDKLFPNNGKKSDPAHPAIYPTGEIPTKANDRELKLYDLIVKRTLATFAPQAIRETLTVTIDVNSELFLASGTITKEKGWHSYYEPYVPYKNDELPILKNKQELKIKSIDLLSKETQSPKRYTPASIIKDLEKKNLGTKATRSAVIDTLYQRYYIQNESIEATDLGLKTIETLEKYCPEIINEKLTKHFEKEMNMIQKNKKHEQEILEEAQKILKKIFTKFKENEVNIGNALYEANVITTNEQSIVGICDKCKNNLRIMYSKKNHQYFIACSNYPECKNTFSVPKNALIKPSKNTCKECNYPTVLVIRKGNRPFEYCINKTCKTKDQYRTNTV